MPPGLDALIPALVYGLPGLLAVALHVGRRSARERHARRVLERSRAAGDREPDTLHPVIDASRCLGCATCVDACPEANVLGLIAGKAELVNPSHCIGHGVCREVCPTGAISLVLGTEERGVDIPKLGPDFQTNVPGVFVAGELAGMGLIRNAIEQGRQAIEAIRKLDGMGRGDRYDVVIVGAGPAGIAAGLTALHHGLRFLVVEQDTLGGTVAHYPRGKIVMTAPVDLPGVGRIQLRETTKEALLSFWHEILRASGLRVRERERVEAVESHGNGLVVRTTRGRHPTRAVLLAIGRRGTPRRLGVPGEDAAKVVYRLVDPEQYRGQRLLVVGGGDSALEAALALGDTAGTHVTLAYRGDAFSRAKPRNRERLEAAAGAGRLRVALGTRVLAIETESVRLATPHGEETVPNDAVVVCAGGILPTPFLRSIGVEVETCNGTPLR